MVIEKLKKHKSPGIDQIPVELIKTVLEKFAMRFINLLYLFGIKWNFPRSGRGRSVPLYKKGDKSDCGNYRGISFSPTTYKFLSNILLSRLTPYAKENYWESSM